MLIPIWTPVLARSEKNLAAGGCNRPGDPGGNHGYGTRSVSLAIYSMYGSLW